MAYVLDAARRMAGGAVLYRDLIDLNPPFIFWLSMPAAVSPWPALAFRVMVLALQFGALAFAWRATAPMPLLRGGFLLMAVGLPLGHFGEREHLMLGLLFPYVVLAALRASGEPVPGGRWRTVAGVAAGLALLLKPPAVLLPLLLGLDQARRHGPAAARRAEHLALVGTGLAGVLAVLVASPGYLAAVRELGPLYASFARIPLQALLYRDIYPLACWVALAVILAALPSHPAPGRLRVLGLVVLALLAAAVAQGKGFGYHYLPALAFGVMAMLDAALAPGPAGRGLALRRVLGTVALVMVLALPFRTLGRWLVARQGRDIPQREALREALQALGPGTPVAILSVRLSDAYPIVHEQRWRNVLSFPHLWFAAADADPAARDSLLARVERELASDPPEVLVVRDPVGAAARPGDVAFDRARFTRGWRERESVGGYRVYERSEK